MQFLFLLSVMNFITGFFLFKSNLKNLFHLIEIIATIGPGDASKCIWNYGQLVLPPKHNGFLKVEKGQTGETCMAT